jgi:hypothetical protein
MNKFIRFLEEFFHLNENKQIIINDEESFNQVYKNQLYNLFCILKIFSPLIGNILVLWIL